MKSLLTLAWFFSLGNFLQISNCTNTINFPFRDFSLWIILSTTQFKKKNKNFL